MTMFAYKFLKTLLVPIYKFWYRPQIVGKENIPTDGSVLLVGNHIHIMDQCNVIMVTKRVIHYMAKKEYFDNKKVAWFFKSTGCIPVDRSKKDESATAAALDVLRGSHALGLFPEGTRNALKDEKIKELYETYMTDEITLDEFKKKIKNTKTSFVNYVEKLVEDKVIKKKDLKGNIFRIDDYLKELIDKKIITEDDYYDNVLLPLKFGAVSMANKTDSYLVPYAICGDYKFRSNNLKIRIGKPFKAEDDLEKANKKLRNEIVKLYKENEKNSVKSVK